MKVVAYTQESGSVAVCVPAKGVPIEKVIERDVPQLVEFIVCRMDELPLDDRDFFNAWELKNGRISVNLQKAKDVRRDQLRSERITLLEELDVEALRNITNPSEISRIEAKKQALRDLPKDPRIDAATSTEELRAVKSST